ncbi:hypothetical protein FSP39_003240 [Pinctada imbricata]|uniref:protein-tyrosine-phosphatase n=1 Tax=Pinctada imbricata TaxID=66713 RepID=A0AA88XWU9_PINIB|nr:hypothetical protein FSP39_003240 [Pinctada imbricata]
MSGRFGQKCDKACSENCLDKTCAISGECLQGCADGFTGDTCALRKMEAGSFPLIPVVLGVLAVIIVLIILAVILMSRRKLNNAKKTRKESRASEVVMSALGPESRMVYENMDISDNTQGGAIKQNKEEKSIYASRGSYALLIELDPESTDIQGNEGTDDVVQQTEYYNVQVNKIAVSALSDVIQKKKDNDEFQTEFESLPQGLTETYTKALEKKNKKRNRYKKIYPYDFNRVKLIGDNTDGGDYINASYLHGFSKENAFIAAQGKRYVASNFKLTYRYIDEVLSIKNPKFANNLSRIYPSELEVKETKETNNSASYLDIMLSYDTDGHINTSLYDKRDDFNFHITSFPFLSRNIPSSLVNGLESKQCNMTDECENYYV